MHRYNIACQVYRYKTRIDEVVIYVVYVSNNGKSTLYIMGKKVLKFGDVLIMIGEVIKILRCYNILCTVLQVPFGKYIMLCW